MTARLVVGAAIVRNGRLLAARRVTPPELAGGWEFPGGKVTRASPRRRPSRGPGGARLSDRGRPTAPR